MDNIISGSLIKEDVFDNLDSEYSKKYPLNTKWNFYFHKIKNDNWDLESYKLLYSFDNIRDFWRLFNNHPKYDIGMFFLMRDNITPLWEDKHNINGGTYSFKIQKQNIENAWSELTIAVISESIFINSNLITGISLHPKYNCFIIKIWCITKINKLTFDIHLKYIDSKTCIYKKNIV